MDKREGWLRVVKIAAILVAILIPLYLSLHYSPTPSLFNTIMFFVLYSALPFCIVWFGGQWVVKGFFKKDKDKNT